MRSTYGSRKIKLFIQGSYANNTNVRIQSSVDIAVVQEEIFQTVYHEGASDSNYNFSTVKPTEKSFKDEVEECLKDKLGRDVEDAFSVYDLFGYTGEAINLATLLSITYERWLWKFNPLESTPVLSKKYTGSLISSYDNIERNAELEIKQTFLTIQIILITGESKSKSLSSTIDDVLEEKN